MFYQKTNLYCPDGANKIISTVHNIVGSENNGECAILLIYE